jgi:hypothetical protein
MTKNELLLKDLLELFLWDEIDLHDFKEKLDAPPSAPEGLRSWLDEISNLDTGYPVANELMRRLIERTVEIRGVNYSDEELARHLDQVFPVPTEYFSATVKPTAEETMLRDLVDHVTARDEDMFVFFDLLRNPPEDGAIPAWIKTAVADGGKLGFSIGVLRELITAAGTKHAFGFKMDKLVGLLDQELLVRASCVSGQTERSTGGSADN